MKQRNGVSRRQFLRGLGLGGTLLLANGGLPAGLANRLGNPNLFASNKVLAEPFVELLAGDVISFALDTNEWAGDFGHVTYRLHQALYNGESAYYIRTDTSSQEYAQENGLVFVPLLNAAASLDNGTSPLYTFDNGHSEQLPVISTVPSEANYNPAWRVHTVTFSGDPVLLDSEAAIREAEANGDVTVAVTALIVNFPIVKWPGGELPADANRLEPLGDGPLITPTDTSNMMVTFKLHQCYPGSRYIVTDTSMPPMATGMNIAASEPTQALADVGATDEIWVFGNGLPGPGVMGFQPAVFDNPAGHPVWSPFWLHFTAVWANEADAVVVTNSTQLRELESAGTLQVFKGVPDMDQSMPAFVVNCPAPIKARNTYVPA
ncbi:MAG: hypothetical protein AAF125_00845 [Chloroflexota bacterium]